MSKITAVFLAPGFEEIEAITVIDVLRRAGFTVITAAVNGNSLTVEGSHGVIVTADCTAEELEPDTLAMTVFPGGLPGSTNLAASKIVLDATRKVSANGGITAAICAAPIALGAAGLLKGRNFTCYPSCEKGLDGNYTAAKVQVDGTLVTACGPGASLDFALELVKCLGKPDVADALRKGMLVD